MATILALDPATRMGWAIFRDGVWDSGTWDLSVQQNKSSGMRYVLLWHHLNAVKTGFGSLDHVVYECPGNLQGHARKVLPAFQGIIELWALLNRIPMSSYKPSTVKMHATGKGTADKVAMIAAARRRWPQFSYRHSDQADALWILNLYLSGIRPDA